MSEMHDYRFDASVGVKQVCQALNQLGFVPRDADGSDYQRGDDQHIRFKVGTSYGEVAVQVVVDNKHVDVIRFLNLEQTGSSKATFEGVIAHYQIEDVELP